MKYVNDRFINFKLRNKHANASNPIHEKGYIVIDSDNQQDFSIKQRKQSHKGKQFSLNSEYRGISGHFSNFYQSHLDFKACDESNIDEEIRIAEQKVKDLEKQCSVLQKTIDNMISHEAELIIQERKRQRSLSTEIQVRKQSSSKRCFIHNYRQRQLLLKDFLKNKEQFQFKQINIQSTYSRKCDTPLIDHQANKKIDEKIVKNRRSSSSNCLGQENIIPAETIFNQGKRPTTNQITTNQICQKTLHPPLREY